MATEDVVVERCFNERHLTRHQQKVRQQRIMIHSESTVISADSLQGLSPEDSVMAGPVDEFFIEEGVEEKGSVRRCRLFARRPRCGATVFSVPADRIRPKCAIIALPVLLPSRERKVRIIR